MNSTKKIYFASDIHLGAHIFKEPLEIEKRFVRWLNQIQKDAYALYLMGDIFDFWFEYKSVVPRGFTRFLGKIAEMHDYGIEIHFFTGNHDIWVFDYLEKETGAIIHRDSYITEIDGKTFFLAHGDGLGDNSHTFHLMHTIFHNRFCQRLFAALHPRWGVGFAHLWSKHNRKKSFANPVPYLGENKEHLVIFAKNYLKSHPDINYFIFGHRHIMLDLMLKKESRIIILGDWMEYFSYAVFNGSELTLEQFEEQE